MKTFKEAWKEKEAEGYQYGPDALQYVKFGWEIHAQHVDGMMKALKAENARLHDLVDSEGTRAVEHLRRARKAEAELAGRGTQEDANNYCQILTLLGMEEEGNPVDGVRQLITELAAAKVDAVTILDMMRALHYQLRNSGWRDMHDHALEMNTVWCKFDAAIDAARTS